jgi:hypothetical protein
MAYTEIRKKRMAHTAAHRKPNGKKSFKFANTSSDKRRPKKISMHK